MTRRTSPALAVLLCAVGGLLSLLSSGREWAHAALPPSAGGTGTVSVTGHQASASIAAVSYGLIALAIAVLAASGVMRRLVGAVVVLIGAGMIGAALYGRGNVSSALTARESEHTSATGLAVHASANGWWVLPLVGGLLAVVAGVMTVVSSGAWSRMGEKYDAPTSAAPTKDPGAVAWDALDRGEDPTE